MKPIEVLACLIFITIIFLAFKKEKKKEMPSLPSREILVPVKYKLSSELENIAFPALKYVETENRPIAITSDKFEQGSFGPCQITIKAFDDANLSFRLSEEFRFKEFPIPTEKEYLRFVLTYSGIILKDYVKKIPLEAKLEDIKHIVLAWVNPHYYMRYLKGLCPPLSDYKKRIQRLNRFLALNGYSLRFSIKPPFEPIYV